MPSFTKYRQDTRLNLQSPLMSDLDCPPSTVIFHMEHISAKIIQLKTSLQPKNRDMSSPSAYEKREKGIDGGDRTLDLKRVKLAS